jgi:hypothetical protein
LSPFCHRRPVPVDSQLRTIPAHNPGRCTPAKVHIATMEGSTPYGGRPIRRAHHPMLAEPPQDE